MLEGVLGGEGNEGPGGCPPGRRREREANTRARPGSGHYSGLAGALDKGGLPFGQTEEDLSSEEPH